MLRTLCNSHNNPKGWVWQQSVRVKLREVKNSLKVTQLREVRRLVSRRSFWYPLYHSPEAYWTYRTPCQSFPWSHLLFSCCWPRVLSSGAMQSLQTTTDPQLSLFIKITSLDSTKILSPVILNYRFLLRLHSSPKYYNNYKLYNFSNSLWLNSFFSRI